MPGKEGRWLPECCRYAFETRDGHVRLISFQLVVFFNSFKKLISFIFKIIVNFSSYFVLFLPEWSFSKIFRSVQYNWLFNETVHSVKKDIFFNLFEKIGCSVKNVLFYFVSKLVRSVKNHIFFPNLSYSVKFVQTIL